MDKIENFINYKFNNKSLLNRALTHSSISKRNNYERLEFLGDSIIDFFTTNWLYKKYPNEKESNLSIKKAQLVNNSNLAKISKKLKLNKFIIIEKNINLSDRIYSNIFESLVGAIYTDSNFNEVSTFLSGTLLKNTSTFNKYIDFKGPLISYYNKNLINNLLINTSKFEDESDFISKIIINNRYFFYGFAKNKASAEQRAASLAFDYLNTKSKISFF